MIKSWKHKGLKKFFDTGSKAGIQSDHKIRLKIILQQLNAAIKPEDMNTPGMGFHKLKGNLMGYFAVTIKCNWRIIFQFEGENATLLDYLDYH